MDVVDSKVDAFTCGGGSALAAIVLPDVGDVLTTNHHGHEVFAFSRCWQGNVEGRRFY